MRINSAVDGQDYYVIRDGAGFFLSIENTWHEGNSDEKLKAASCWWGPFKAAAQFYKSMPDRVHLFDARGKFIAACGGGLEVALVLLERHGGHLVYMSGQTDEPLQVDPFDKGLALRGPSVWDWLRTPGV